MSDPSILLLVACVDCAKTPTPVRVESPPHLLTAASAGRDNLLSRISTSTKLLLQPAAPETVLAAAWSAEDTSKQMPALRLGSQNQAVIKLQTQLRQLGYNTGAVDGYYGSQTRTAVVQFQRAQGLQADGIAGAQTWIELERAVAQQTPAPADRKPTVVPPSPADRPEPSPAARERSDSADRSSTAPERSPHRRNPDNNRSFLSSSHYIWIWGWGIIYVGGCVLIARDLAKELRGFHYVIGSDQTQAIQAVAERRRTVKRHRTVSPVTAQTQDKRSTGQKPEQKPEQKSDQKPAATLRAQHTAPIQTHSPPIDSLMIVDAATPPLQLEADSITRRRAAKTQDAAPVVNHNREDTKNPAAGEGPASIPPSNGAEMLVAVLPHDSAQQKYRYTLVQDASGLFVIRGNELRIPNHCLNRQVLTTSHVLTIRQTNTKGQSIDKSFKIELDKQFQLPQSPQATPA
jgi:peptidoglycan hydrolase-like protein with peptidoglycan-binding domain